MNERRKSMLLYPLILLLLIGGGFALIWFLGSSLQPLQSPRSLTSNLVFFLLINLNIVVIMVLGFLVIKNLVRLVADRKRRISGSRLRSRLVAAFVGLSLVPTVLLFIVSKGILASVLQGWFSPQIAAGVDGAVAAARFHYDYREAELSRNAYYSANTLNTLLGFLELDLQSPGSEIDIVHSYVDALIRERGLGELSIVDSSGRVVAQRRSGELAASVIDVPGPHLGAVGMAAKGRVVVRTEQAADAEFLRAYAPLRKHGFGAALAPSSVLESHGNGRSELVLVASVWVSHKLNRILTQVVEAYDDYKELRINRRPLASTYLLTLAGVTLLIVFAAIWVGFFLAKTLTEPIQQLAEGTQQVAKGNLSFQIPESGDDEISLLVKLFNTMTSDLRETRDELVSGRQYMETVLESVDVGVLSVDVTRRISTCNTAATAILGMPSPAEVVGQAYADIVPAALSTEIDEYFERFVNSTGPATSNISVAVGGASKHVQVSVAALVDQSGDTLGAVVLVDDFTELVKAQRMAAWREVARRIAHEIKNPLTPIQLNAQRMQRRFVGKDDEAPPEVSTEQARSLIGTCTETIIDQVQVLRGLVNEFSRFARMPKTEPVRADLNELVASVCGMYREAHPAIRIMMTVDEELPPLLIDREQMNRALVNILDNAVSAVKERFQNVQGSEADWEDRGEAPVISVKTVQDPSLGVAILSIADNGVGISKNDRLRVFEPHFSTKKGGTGLGLAIVHSIIADHSGYVRIRDNEGAGVRFVVELPIPDLHQPTST